MFISLHTDTDTTFAPLLLQMQMQTMLAIGCLPRGKLLLL